MIRRRLTPCLAVLLVTSAAGAADLPKLTYNPKHAEMVRFVVAAAEASPWVSVAAIGRSVRGRQIPVVILHDPNQSPLEMTRVLVLCRQHGNEPAGTTAALGLLRDFVNGEAEHLKTQLQKICLLIVPMVNPDGADANLRHNANDVDLNRDWIGRSQPESQAVEYLFNLWKPHAVLDLHELHWRDRHGLNTIEAPSANVLSSDLGKVARGIQAAIMTRLQAAGFPSRYSYWDGSNHGGLCHRHFVRDHAVMSLLFESERQGMRTPLPRRTQMHRIGLQTVLDYYYRNGVTDGYPRLAMAPAASLPPVSTDAPTPFEQSAGGRGQSILDRRHRLAEETTERGERMGPAAPESVGPVSIDILAPDIERPIPTSTRFDVRLGGVHDLKYLVVRIDGEGRFFSNRAPYQFKVDLEPGVHTLLVQAHRDNGSVVEREVTVTVADETVEAQ